MIEIIKISGKLSKSGGKLSSLAEAMKIKGKLSYIWEKCSTSRKSYRTSGLIINNWEVIILSEKLSYVQQKIIKSGESYQRLTEVINIWELWIAQKSNITDGSCGSLRESILFSRNYRVSDKLSTSGRNYLTSERVILRVTSCQRRGEIFIHVAEIREAWQKLPMSGEN